MKARRVAWFVALLALLGGIAAQGARLLTDPALKIQLIHAAFPNAIVNALPPSTSWDPIRWRNEKTVTDALAGEPEYELIQVPNDANGFFPLSRLRFRAFELDSASGHRRFAALAHQHILPSPRTDIAPAICCEWTAQLFLLVDERGTWRVTQTKDSLIYRGNTIRRFEVADIDGDGFEEAIVEAERSSGAGADGVGSWFEMYVIALTGPEPKALLDLPVLGMANSKIKFTAELDRDETRKYRGAKYCFNATVFEDPRPRKMSACFDRATRVKPPWW
jgi:hypothetical protein